jgi:FtsP/CotA-like multicopper oxidase with cupredoxin domain
MNKKYTIIIALIAIVVVLIFVYRVRISTKIQPPTFVPSSEIKTQDSNVYGFIIEGKEYSFNPSRIEIEGGKKVRLVFQNRGTMPHNLEV